MREHSNKKSAIKIALISEKVGRHARMAASMGDFRRCQSSHQVK